MKNEPQTCMNCLNDFDQKEVSWVMSNGREVLYCNECIIKTKAVVVSPYVKPRKKKVK